MMPLVTWPLALSLACLGVLLVTAFRRPRPLTELAVAAVTSAAVLGSGAVPWDEAGEVVRGLGPVALFLVFVLLVGHLCAEAGLFEALGGLIRTAARQRPVRLMTTTFVVAVLVTVTLSLDATVVLLTPVAVAAAAGARAPAYACVRVAHAGSLLLPVANLTNLLAFAQVDLGFVGWAAAMAAPTAAALAVEYVGLRWFFRREGTVEQGAGASPTATPRLPRVHAAVVLLMLIGFVVTEPWGVEPFWVAAAAALALLVHARGRTGARPAARAASVPFAAYLLALGVVTAAVAHLGLTDLVRGVLPPPDTATSWVGLLSVAVVATALSAVVNNLPATLVLVPVVAPLGTMPVLAALVGLGVGAALVVTASLASMLWLRTTRAAGLEVDLRELHTVSLALTPPALLAAVTALWAVGPWVGA